MGAYWGQGNLRTLPHAEDICDMLCDVDFNTRVAGFEFLGHILDDEDVTLLAFCSLFCAVQWGLLVMMVMMVVMVMVMRALRLLFRIRTENVNSHEAAWLCLITYEVEIEQHFIPGEGLIDGDGPSPLDT